MKPVVSDDEYQVTHAVGGMMPCADGQRIVGIEVEIEVRTGVRAPKSRQAVPVAANLKIEAAAEKSHPGRLYRWLQLQIVAQADRGIGAGTRLGAEHRIRIDAHPCARIIGTPAQVGVGTRVVGIKVLADGEFPGWHRGAIQRRGARDAGDECSRPGWGLHKLAGVYWCAHGAIVAAPRLARPTISVQAQARSG